ncbi:uncharacterized protein LOC126678307 [Mercurialis annua]|uniref:uncharacterized protein LOC126678307 n=1 Tax=Mercurialis annua TaxID=3986 RepID=UPI00215F81FA|nr:uncharacterized protein LOC126678307 [Mercurialis annua]
MTHISTHAIQGGESTQISHGMIIEVLSIIRHVLVIKENKDHNRIRATSRVKETFTNRKIGHNIHLMAIALQIRNQGGLPFTTEANPREQVKAITLRSSKVLPEAHAEKVILEEENEQCEEKEPEKVVTKPTPLPPYIPKIPFPQRLKKPKDTWKFHQFLETFKKLQINISLADALREMPHNVKFLKDIITNKRSWEADGTVPMTKNCISIILRNFPTKLRDPGSFTIPCTIGNMQSINCLCNLGASINLMPLSLFRSMFGDQQVQATPMMLQLADHSLKKPHGIVDDVLVKVNKFIFHVDFVVLDYAADKYCPMILGRPFMNTGRALINVHDGKLTLMIGEESVDFDMKKITRHPNTEEKCMHIDMVDELVISLKKCRTKAGPRIPGRLRPGKVAFCTFLKVPEVLMSTHRPFISDTSLIHTQKGIFLGLHSKT